jgi:PKD repeat protein
MKPSAPARSVRAAISLACCAAGVLAFGAGSASAAAPPPPNDNLAAATPITSLPFTQDTIDVRKATAEPGEPTGCSSSGDVHNTVWYTIQPAHDELVQLVSGYTSELDAAGLFRVDGAGFGGLTSVGCADSSAQVFALSAGTTYAIQFASSYPVNPPFTSFDFQMLTGPSPDNDAFADATSVTSLPASLEGDYTYSTLEPGEPTSGCSSYDTPNGSVWYRFTAPADETVALVHFANAIVYSGDTLAGLTPLAGGDCYSSSAVFHAVAGQTYSIQVIRGDRETGTYDIQLEQAPPVTADFFWYPSAPSSRDDVSFFDESRDPVGQSFEPATWDFGDGSPTQTGGSVSHRFSRDGDYTVTMSTSTEDGRTATTSELIQVRTHDVAVTSFDVPATAKVGQTVTIRVTVASVRYRENVSMEVDQGQDGWFTSIDQQGPIAVAPRRPHTFAFEYTFTRADAKRKVVAFQATASPDSNDVDETNNTVIATTRVTR